MFDTDSVAHSAHFRPRTLWSAPRFGLYFISGQRFFFHCRIASSSRFNARLVGRWQVHPNCRNFRQTWPGWYLTPHSSPIKWATRLAIHRLVSCPRARLPVSNRPRSSSVPPGSIAACDPNAPPARARPTAAPIDSPTSGALPPDAPLPPPTALTSTASPPLYAAVPMLQSSAVIQVDFPCPLLYTR